MLNQLIPLPEHSPPSVKHLPLAKRIDLWLELVTESDTLMLSGLRARIGADGDLPSAYRAWYGRRMAKHDDMLATFAANLNGGK